MVPDTAARGLDLPNITHVFSAIYRAKYGRLYIVSVAQVVRVVPGIAINPA